MSAIAVGNAAIKQAWSMSRGNILLQQLFSFEARFRPRQG
jgi:hypothetical protein